MDILNIGSLMCFYI